LTDIQDQGFCPGEDSVIESLTLSRLKAGVAEEVELPGSGRVVDDADALEPLAQRGLFTALRAPLDVPAFPVDGLAPGELRVGVGGLVGRVPAAGLQPPGGVLELGEQSVELVQARDIRHAVDLRGTEVDEQFARYHDGYLALPKVAQAGDVVRVGERWSVDDHFAGVEVFVHGGAAVRLPLSTELP
jgi:hypothetical protein